MKIVIILNGISSKKKLFYSSILPVLQKAHEIVVLETRRAGHAKQLAADYAPSCDALVAAGGDGTLHEVLNGISATPHRPALGVIPLGSGNDFAGACKIKLQPHYLLKLLAQPPKPTDVGHIVCKDGNNSDKEIYFMNVCSAGMGPSTVAKMATMPRWLSANGRYMLAILQTFFTHRPAEVMVESTHFCWQGPARVVAIANGQSFGNKIFIAPDATLNDGQFNLFVGGNVPLLKFLWYLQKIKKKRKVNGSQVYYAMGSEIKLSSVKAAMLEADGELVGWLPAKVTIGTNRFFFFR